MSSILAYKLVVTADGTDPLVTVDATISVKGRPYALHYDKADLNLTAAENTQLTSFINTLLAKANAQAKIDWNLP